MDGPHYAVLTNISDLIGMNVFIPSAEKKVMHESVNYWSTIDKVELEKKIKELSGDGSHTKKPFEVLEVKGRIKVTQKFILEHPDEK